MTAEPWLLPMMCVCKPASLSPDPYTCLKKYILVVYLHIYRISCLQWILVGKECQLAVVLIFASRILLKALKGCHVWQALMSVKAPAFSSDLTQRWRALTEATARVGITQMVRATTLAFSSCWHTSVLRQVIFWSFVCAIQLIQVTARRSFKACINRHKPWRIYHL